MEGVRRKVLFKVLSERTGGLGAIHLQKEALVWVVGRGMLSHPYLSPSPSPHSSHCGTEAPGQGFHVTGCAHGVKSDHT